MRKTRFSGAVGLLALVGCGVPEQPEALKCDEYRYEAAVRDSASPTATDVYTGLWAISSSNPKLAWSEDKTMVKMVAWTTFTGYAQGDNTLTREVWVTAVPQLQEFCRTVADEQRVARINQYLGLPPAVERDNGRKFVEMWVRPVDMFRPCPDAEIDDTACGLQYPATATTEHKSWFNNNYASSFGFWQQTRYPWTGLGYTYDWCNAQTVVGASEFVIRSGSTVKVIGYVERAAYCGQ